MNAAKIWPGLGAKRTVLVCNSWRDGSDTPVPHRVPVEHRPLKPLFGLDAAALAGLPDGPSLGDLKTILEETGGLGLFVPKKLPVPAATPGKTWQPQSSSEQSAVGSIIVWPPGEWARLRREFADWQFEGVDRAFEGLPYGFADVIPFAGINFSPDCWLLVTRGPMAGMVVWFTHDGDSQMDEPWAESVAAWGERVWREVPELFGGVIQFNPLLSEPPVTDSGGDLYPERLEVE